MDYSKLSDAEIAQKVWFWWQHNIDHDKTLCSISGDKFLYVKEGIWTRFDPCNNAADSWPIILQSRLYIDPIFINEWCVTSECDSYREIHKNPLRAAMICYLMMQEGE